MGEAALDGTGEARGETRRELKDPLSPTSSPSRAEASILFRGRMVDVASVTEVGFMAGGGTDVNR
jgi:hypothetical protein